MNPTSMPAVAAAVNLRRDESGVHVLEGHESFAYTEGSEAERYLAGVLDACEDLGSTSVELERHIVDWNSEYHLSVKRAQLLAGFEFKRSLRTLEVGCGCGAITRFLGERLDSVVAIEGSLARARMARQRTADLAGVSIICAPFQQISFEDRFDLIVCIGVFEYSAAFIEADDPYAAVLERFASMLAPGGQLILAIENRFGAKYLNGCPEDHVRRRFEGIEGYPMHGDRIRTFGRRELSERLGKHFGELDFYYPFPDYKLPDCVLSHEFLQSGRAAELVAGLSAHDYSDDGRRLWNDARVVYGLAENGLSAELANSFIVLASRTPANGVAFDQLGLMFSVSRRARFRTRTEIRARAGRDVVEKRRLHPCDGPVGLLEHHECSSDWQGGLSLASVIRARCMEDQSLATLFAPATPWVDYLKSEALSGDGRLSVAGEHIDSIWSNVYIVDGVCSLVDREWVWGERIPLNVLVIRAIIWFLYDIADIRTPSLALTPRSGRALCSAIAETLDLTLSDKDYDDYLTLQSEFNHAAGGVDRRRARTSLGWYLRDRSLLRTGVALKAKTRSLITRSRSRLKLTLGS